MKRPEAWKRHWSAAALALAGLAFTACFTACFTEVGNPDEETSMTAVMRIDAEADSATADAPDSAAVLDLRLRIHEAIWTTADSTRGTLWNENALTADFAGGDSLPRRNLGRVEVESLAVTLSTVVRAPGPLAVDTLDWGAFHGAGYLRGTYDRGGARHAFLFALPDTGAFTLGYGREALEAWRSGHQYRCRFTFEVRRWLTVPGLDSAQAGADATGRPVVILDPLHNPALHALLTQRFFRAFNGSRTYAAKAAPTR